jgi:hypothetical protein
MPFQGKTWNTALVLLAAATTAPAAVGTSTLGTQLSAIFEEDDGPTNTLFSALSIETCFSLIYPGAGGVTRSQIASTLGCVALRDDGFSWDPVSVSSAVFSSPLPSSFHRVASRWVAAHLPGLVLCVLLPACGGADSARG